MPSFQSPLDVNNLPGVITGEAGTRWTNDTDKILYQLHVQFRHSCARCIQYANRVGPWWPIPWHYGCNCTQSPVPPGHQALPFLDYREEMANLSPAEQRRAMGASNWRLVESGAVEWKDVVTKSRIRTLEEVVDRKRLTLKQLTQAGVKPGIAQRALMRTTVNPANIAANVDFKNALERLRALGLSNEEIRKGFAQRMAARAGVTSVTTGPSRISGPPKPPPAPPQPPTPPAQPKPPKKPKPAPKAPQAAKPSTSKPPGTPVSAALDNRMKGKRKEVSEAMSAIDKVHGDGSLPKIPVEVDKSPDFHGRYTFNRYPDGSTRPVKISINETGPTPRLTFAHEAGHFLDRAGIPSNAKPGNREYTTDPLMKEWRDAVQGSQAFRTLEDTLNAKRIHYVSVTGTYRHEPPDKKYAGYLLQDTELWARSYAQFIATRSRDAEMMKELDSVRSEKGWAAHYPQQWSDDDFKPIEKAIEKLFAKLGWM